jgi:3'-phosphoadenosine 5'-phosphosulfate (PAPS) 3'-phosphatase
VAVSCRRSNNTQHSLLNSLGAKKVPCGGSGYKLAMLIKGEVDAVIFIESPLSTWDSCAG